MKAQDHRISDTAEPPKIQQTTVQRTCGRSAFVPPINPLVYGKPERLEVLKSANPKTYSRILIPKPPQTCSIRQCHRSKPIAAGAAANVTVSMSTSPSTCASATLCNAEPTAVHKQRGKPWNGVRPLILSKSSANVQKEIKKSGLLPVHVGDASKTVTSAALTIPTSVTSKQLQQPVANARLFEMARNAVAETPPGARRRIMCVVLPNQKRSASVGFEPCATPSTLSLPECASSSYALSRSANVHTTMSSEHIPTPSTVSCFTCIPLHVQRPVTSTHEPLPPVVHTVVDMISSQQQMGDTGARQPQGGHNAAGAVSTSVSTPGVTDVIPVAVPCSVPPTVHRHSVPPAVCMVSIVSSQTLQQMRSTDSLQPQLTMGHNVGTAPAAISTGASTSRDTGVVPVAVMSSAPSAVCAPVISACAPVPPSVPPAVRTVEDIVSFQNLQEAGNTETLQQQLSVGHNAETAPVVISASMSTSRDCGVIPVAIMSSAPSAVCAAVISACAPVPPSVPPVVRTVEGIVSLQNLQEAGKLETLQQQLNVGHNAETAPAAISPSVSTSRDSGVIPVAIMSIAPSAVRAGVISACAPVPPSVPPVVRTVEDIVSLQNLQEAGNPETLQEQLSVGHDAETAPAAISPSVSTSRDSGVIPVATPSCIPSAVRATVPVSASKRGSNLRSSITLWQALNDPAFQPTVILERLDCRITAVFAQLTLQRAATRWTPEDSAIKQDNQVNVNEICPPSKEELDKEHFDWQSNCRWQSLNLSGIEMDKAKKTGQQSTEAKIYFVEDMLQNHTGDSKRTGVIPKGTNIMEEKHMEHKKFMTVQVARKESLSLAFSSLTKPVEKPNLLEHTPPAKCQKIYMSEHKEMSPLPENISNGPACHVLRETWVISNSPINKQERVYATKLSEQLECVQPMCLPKLQTHLVPEPHKISALPQHNLINVPSSAGQDKKTGSGPLRPRSEQVGQIEEPSDDTANREKNSHTVMLQNIDRSQYKEALLENFSKEPAQVSLPICFKRKAYIECEPLITQHQQMTPTMTQFGAPELQEVSEKNCLIVVPEEEPEVEEIEVKRRKLSSIIIPCIIAPGDKSARRRKSTKFHQETQVAPKQTSNTSMPLSDNVPEEICAQPFALDRHRCQSSDSSRMDSDNLVDMVIQKQAHNMVIRYQDSGNCVVEVTILETVCPHAGTG